MDEIWVDIRNFPNYMISNCGRVFSKFYNRVIGPGGVTNGGYLQAHLYKNKKRHVKYIHRLVAEHFLSDSITGKEVDHLDDNKTNNTVYNLEVVTGKVNSQRAYDRGMRVPPSMKPVRIVETGANFRSLNECARFLDRALSTVSEAAIKGSSVAGYHLEYISNDGGA